MGTFRGWASPMLQYAKQPLALRRCAQDQRKTPLWNSSKLCLSLILPDGRSLQHPRRVKAIRDVRDLILHNVSFPLVLERVEG